MSVTTRALLLSASSLFAPVAGALTIDFDDLAPGTSLDSQYAAQGVLFSANAFSGSGSSSSGEAWATNTDMTIVSLVTGIAGEDYGALGNPSLVSNHILHSYLAWLGEDGDPSFSMEFGTPASTVSVTFAGLGGAALAPDTRIFAYAGSLPVGSVFASWPDDSVGQLTLTIAAPGITRVAVAPGSYADWVGVDQISITPVPEPGRWALMAMGLAGLLAARRRA